MWIKVSWQRNGRATATCRVGNILTGKLRRVTAPIDRDARDPYLAVATALASKVGAGVPEYTGTSNDGESYRASDPTAE